MGRTTPSGLEVTFTASLPEVGSVLAGGRASIFGDLAALTRRGQQDRVPACIVLGNNLLDLIGAPS